MLKLFSWLKGNNNSAMNDARRVYSKTMAQSRNAVFFTPGYVTDSYDGRMEVLCMHLAILLRTFKKHGEEGRISGQALYDVMIDDFDVALREECLSDTAVKRRIKPLAKMFFTQAKVYSDALDSSNEGDLGVIVSKFITSDGKKHADYTANFSRYIRAYSTILDELSLGQIVKGGFSYPNLT
ncbi:MAG: ubiquinol-cytochrome C chaperone family protein [Robiginitomaculum sp.]